MPDVIGPMGVRCRIMGVCQGVFMAAIVAYGFYRSMAAFALLLILVFLAPRLVVFFMPFVVGFILSLIANPLVRFLEKKIK